MVEHCEMTCFTLVQFSQVVFSVAAKLQLFLTLMRQELGFQTRSVC